MYLNYINFVVLALAYQSMHISNIFIVVTLSEQKSAYDFTKLTAYKIILEYCAKLSNDKQGFPK